MVWHTRVALMVRDPQLLLSSSRRYKSTNYSMELYLLSLLASILLPLYVRILLPIINDKCFEQVGIDQKLY